MTITITVTDGNLANAKAIGGSWKLKARRKFNAPGSGTVTVPATPRNTALMVPGNRVVVARGGQVWTSGPIETPFDYSWQVGAGEDSTPGRLSIQFTDDLAKIVGYKVYPTPSSDFEHQTTVDAYTRTAVNGELLLRDLVNLNCGPGAIAARLIPGLVLGAVAGVGTNVNFASRFGDMGDELRSVALAAGGIGFRALQVGSNVEFQVYQPRDRTAAVRFSRSRRNLTAIQYRSKAPTTTTALVAGQGEGAARTTKEVRDAAAEAAWAWRIEQFVDQRQSNDATVLVQAGQEAIAKGAAQYTLSTVTVDTDLQRYGRDYDLGDKVTVEVLPGLDVADLVREVELVADPGSGEFVTAVVGSGDVSTDPAWLRHGRDLARQLAKVQRR